MRGSSQRRLIAGLFLLLVWQAGCAAFRPMQGVPARYLPNEMKLGDRSNRRTIDLSLLRQTPPPAHLIDSGDVLGVYVEGFVGKSSDPPPVYFPINNDSPPSFGLPYPVREDGTISLPFVGSVSLRGMTLAQAEARVIQAYLTPRQLIRPDFHRVQVNLQRPRQYRVLVIRQDSRTDPNLGGAFGQLNMGVVKRGTGKVVNLPAYSNDVLNALTATDGLPGLDAENAVYVIRRRGNSQGGALDPRWPTDLDPTLLLRQGTHAETPIVRGQSHETEAEFMHRQRVTQAMHFGLPDRRVQQVNEGHAYSDPAAQGSISQTPLEPPRIWDNRMGVAPVAFEPAAAQGAYSQGSRGSYPTDARLHSNGTMPVNPQAELYQPGMPSPNGPAYSAEFNPNQPYGPHALQGQPAPELHGHPSGVQPPGPPSNGMPPIGISPNGVPQYGVPPYGMTPNGMVPNGMPAGGQYTEQAPSWNPPPTIPGDNGPGYQPPVANGMELGVGHGIGGPDGMLDGRHVIRIPIRLGPGETADIRPEDVLLFDGDIIFIESRDTEVFYTGGLLGGGQYTLPRDYDLDILQALSLAQSRGVSGAARQVGGVSALNNDVSISPSMAIVLRKLPDGGEIPVKIDLYRARSDLSERIVIQPGDYILLQYTPLEAIGAFFERHLLESAIFGLAAQNFSGGGN